MHESRIEALRETRIDGTIAAHLRRQAVLDANRIRRQRRTDDAAERYDARPKSERDGQALDVLPKARDLGLGEGPERGRDIVGELREVSMTRRGEERFDRRQRVLEAAEQDLEVAPLIVIQVNTREDVIHM